MTGDTNMAMPRAPAVGSQPVRVGVLAATSEDTRFGEEVCLAHGYFPICAHISDSPQAQTKLQMKEPEDHELTNATIEKVKELIDQGVEAIMIYCNSLSSVVDMKRVKDESRGIDIITPLDAYKPLLKQYQCFGILAANCQCTANLERFVIEDNENAIVIGLGSLSLVNDVEGHIIGEEIIARRQLLTTVVTLWIHGAQIVILACTHFSKFHAELSAALERLDNPIRLYEPTADMMALLQQRLAV